MAVLSEQHLARNLAAQVGAGSHQPGDVNVFQRVSAPPTAIMQNARLPKNESGIKPPHSKTAQTLL
jgi:hypothetical protein